MASDENARRVAWLSASVEVTETLLGADPADALQLVASGARSVTGGTIASIEVPVGNDSVRIAAYDAAAARDIRGRVVRLDESPLYRTVAESGKPLLIETARDPRVLASPALAGFSIGSVLVVPLLAGGNPIGALIVANDPQSPPFRPADVELARTFGAHAGLVFGFVQAQRDRRRVAVLEDRERIADDLSEGVINRLFAVGMQLSALAPTVPGPAAASLLRTVTQLDDVIAELRAAVFSLQETFAAVRPGPAIRPRLSERITQIAQESGVTTTVRLHGDAEARSTDQMTELLCDVLQKTLFQVASTAAPDPAEISVAASVSGVTLTVRVTDAALAPGLASDRRWNELTRRSAQLGGRLAVTAGVPNGAVVTCQVPASAPDRSDFTA